MEQLTQFSCWKNQHQTHKAEIDILKLKTKRKNCLWKSISRSHQIEKNWIDRFPNTKVLVGFKDYIEYQSSVAIDLKNGFIFLWWHWFDETKSSPCRGGATFKFIWRHDHHKFIVRIWTCVTGAAGHFIRDYKHRHEHSFSMTKLELNHTILSIYYQL